MVTYKFDCTMKKIFNISVAALALFGAIACNTTSVDEVVESQNVVTASFVESRTALVDGVKTVWSADDKIEVNGVTFSLTSGAGESAAVFTSAQPVEVAQSYTATYPAGVTVVPTTQSAVAGSFDPAAALAVATNSSLNNMLFEYKHALVKFSLPADAAKVELLGYTLAGELKTGTTYYIAIAAGQYDGVVAKVDGVVVKQGQSALNAVNGKIYNLGVLEAEAVQSPGIRTADDLLAFAATVMAQIAAEQTPDGGEWKDENGVVNILADIDMAGKTWPMITNFAGTLEGNNKTINNLVFETTGSSAAMFKNLSDATIQNLTFGKGCKFSATGVDSDKKSYVSAVVARVLKGATLTNITSYATLVGGYRMGAIAGAADMKGGKVLFNGCNNYGSLTFTKRTPTTELYVGGICGANEANVIYTDCYNEGVISVYPDGGAALRIGVGGIIGLGTDHDMSGCDTKGQINVEANITQNAHIGGIVGRAFRCAVSECNSLEGASINVTKSSKIRALYLGGILGNMEGSSTRETVVYNCTNNIDLKADCTLSNDALVGGITGYHATIGCTVSECVNNGDVTLAIGTANSGAGGIIGLINAAPTTAVKTKTSVKNCTNNGAIMFDNNKNTAWIHLAGIVGRTYNNNCVVEGCTNNGDVTYNTLSRSNPAGIVSETKCDVKNCVNNGTICATSAHTDYYSGVAGIVSRTQDAITISGCKNYGTMIYNGKGFNEANNKKGIVGQGGIVALFSFGTIDNCENYGTILGNDYDASLGKAAYVNAKGSIVGWGGEKAATTIKNCKVGGALGSCDDTAQDMGASAAVAITAENYANHIFGGNASQGVTVTNCSFASAQ